MTAVMVMSSAAASAVSLYATFATLLIAGVVFAPQAIKKDKRVVVAVALVALLIVIGHAIEAGPWICPYQGTIFEWLCYVP